MWMFTFTYIQNVAVKSECTFTYIQNMDVNSECKHAHVYVQTLNVNHDENIHSVTPTFGCACQVGKRLTTSSHSHRSSYSQESRHSEDRMRGRRGTKRKAAKKGPVSSTGDTVAAPVCLPARRSQHWKLVGKTICYVRKSRVLQRAAESPNGLEAFGSHQD